MNQDSFDRQVAALQPGSSVCRIVEVDTKRTMTEVSAALPELRIRMNNAISQPIARAKLKTDGHYRSYVSHVTTTDGSMFTVGIVRREK